MIAAYEGTAGSHSEAALQQILEQKSEHTAQGFESFQKVCEAVVNGIATIGLLPIDNSIAGTNFQVLELLISHNLSITGEVEQEEEQVLVALEGTTLDEIVEISAHPYSVHQCEELLSTFTGKVVISNDTPGFCKLIKDQNLRGLAAITSRRAASIHSLAILKSLSSAVTRYVVVSKVPITPERHLSPRTTIQVILKNQVGAIMRATSVFAHRDISVSKIESRPSTRSIKLQRAWEYILYMDLEMGTNEPKMLKALDNLREYGKVRVLGSYPRYLQPQSESVAFSYGS